MYHKNILLERKCGREHSKQVRELRSVNRKRQWVEHSTSISNCVAWFNPSGESRLRKPVSRPRFKAHMTTSRKVLFPVLKALRLYLWCWRHGLDSEVLRLNLFVEMQYEVIGEHPKLNLEKGQGRQPPVCKTYTGFWVGVHEVEKKMRLEMDGLALLRSMDGSMGKVYIWVCEM